MIKVYRPVASQYPITSKYGTRKDPVTGQESAMHYGVDFGVPVGTPVVSATDGEVVAARWQDSNDKSKGFGLFACIFTQINGKGHQIYYGHLSELAVKEGDRITAGTRVGLSGHTGKSSGPHLHFEVRPLGGKGIEVEFIS